MFQKVRIVSGLFTFTHFWGVPPKGVARNTSMRRTYIWGGQLLIKIVRRIVVHFIRFLLVLFVFGHKGSANRLKYKEKG